jgi:hypothetical protein
MDDRLWGHASTLLVCHRLTGRKWFSRLPDVPRRWFPRSEPDAESFAFGVLLGDKPEHRAP